MFQIPQRDELDEAAEAALTTTASENRLSDAVTGGRRRITQQEADAIKRRMTNGFGRYFTLAQRMEFLEMYEVERGEPPLAPEDAYRASQRPKPPKDESRGMAAAIKKFLGVSTGPERPISGLLPPTPLTDEEKAAEEAARRKRTFFT